MASNRLSSATLIRYVEEFEEQSISPASPDADFALAHVSGERRVGPPFMYQSAVSAFGLSETDAAARAPRYASDAKA